MKQQWLLAIAVGTMTLGAVARTTMAQNVSPCPDANNCAKVALSAPSDTKHPGDVVTVGLKFDQGPTTGDPGGLGNIAALALTVQEQGGGTATPLTLADCTLNADGLPAAVKPDASLSNPPGFRVVVENACCGGGRTHCLCACPDDPSPTTPDNFINLVVYGPNPLPAPGTGVEIPTLPSSGASGQLLTIDLKVDQTAKMNVTLHLLNQTDTSARPQFTAMLSVGDKTAVDQTCSPLAVPGTAPCAAGGSTSQVAFTDASIAVSAPLGVGCIGSCGHNCNVTPGNLLTGLDILLGNLDLISCDAWGDNGAAGTDVSPGRLLTGLDNLLQGCPAECVPQ